MAFIRESGKFYRMPVFFGPMPCPRWWPQGIDEDFAVVPYRTAIGVKYLTDRDLLEAMLPEGFSVWGEPVLTVEFTYMTGFSWLAGGGYAMGDVKFPCVYQSKEGPVHGTFLLVRWEDLADPILTGREELGHNKLFCDIHPIQDFQGRNHAKLSWRGNDFCKIAVEDLVDSEPAKPNPDHKGLLSYKYIPATPRLGEKWGDSADAAYATLTPPAWSGGETVMYKTGAGSVEWQRPSFEEQPTQYNVINGFANLPVLAMRGGWVLAMTGGASGIDTRRID
jgi:Acetoacetate decarboxylase (ADC)